MEWTEEQREAIWHAFIDNYEWTWDGDPMRDMLETPLHWSIIRALELKTESGGTMTAERIARVFSGRILAIEKGEIREHMVAQGATVATIQAKVAELAKDGTDARAERDAAREDVSSLRAEVERLKAELRQARGGLIARLNAMVETRNSLLRHKQEALTAAESRLAAFRATAIAARDRCDRAKALLAPQPATPNGPMILALIGSAAHMLRYEALEGDAPQEAKCVCAVKNIACIHKAVRLRRGQEAKDSPMDASEGRCASPVGLNNRPCCLPPGHDGWHMARPPATQRYPCSPTCTHDDARNPGHPERVRLLSGDVVQGLEGVRNESGPGRVKERSKAVNDPIGALAKDAGAKQGREVASYRCGYEQACDDMRAACLTEVRNQLEAFGALDVYDIVKRAIESATP